jgi:hypothetical protein
MRHVDEGALQALIDGEVPAMLQAELFAHVESCGECAADLDALGQLTSGLRAALGAIDVVPPMLPARKRIRAEARRRMLLSRTTILRRAALFLLFSAAAVSATVPGSPVRDWLADAWQSVAARPAPPSELPAIASVEETETTDRPAGVSVHAGAASIRVVVTSPEPGLVLQVRMHDGDRLGVWASGVAAKARFLTSQDRIEVVSPGAGEVRVDIPYSAESVSLDVDGRPYLVKEGGDLRFLGPGAERTGPQIRFEVTQ